MRTCGYLEDKREYKYEIRSKEIGWGAARYKARIRTDMLSLNFGTELSIYAV
jgi:hypothetical protein